MADNKWTSMEVIFQAAMSTFGWALVLACVIVVAFFCGYSIGHREVMGLSETFQAFLWVPLVWLQQPLMIVAYVVTAVAYYLPTRFESRWLYVAAMISTFSAWLVVVAVAVQRASHSHRMFWIW